MHTRQFLSALRSFRTREPRAQFFQLGRADSEPRAVLSGTGLLVVAGLILVACGWDGVVGAEVATGGNSVATGGVTIATGGTVESTGGVSQTEPSEPLSWFEENTVAHRVDLPMAQRGAVLNAEALAVQLAGYDPGSLLRCAVSDNTDYRAAIDRLGGVTWGYGVRPLEDLSRPRFQAGIQKYDYRLFSAMNDGAAPEGAVEIVKPDIVAVTESAALFYSSSHGLMVVDLTGDAPVFKCATQLPGVVDQFFFHKGHLVAMAKQQAGAGSVSFLVHFNVDASNVEFVETVELGEVNILDSRRFNDKLVFYTDLRLQPAPEQPATDPAGGAAPTLVIAPSQGEHRALRVFSLGDRLEEEMSDTLIDSTLSEDQLVNTGVEQGTAVNSVVHESRRFGRNMWASDHYFAVTETIRKTRFAGWQSRTYSVCTASHTVEYKYRHCSTQYETRPNPAYTPPDNSSGDRACKSVTLSDCLREVARVANETIQVPVGRTCEDRTRSRWVCDTREQRTTDYPTFTYEAATQLFIYEYTPSGFVRLDTSVHEITNEGLGSLEFEAPVSTLTTSTETFDLEVPGTVQTLRFVNGILYVISEGVLQVYTLSGSSLVRTATLKVVNDSLQSTLFSADKLFLSDFGYRNGADTSALRVVDLSNPAFPSIEGSTHQLPGGHSSIMASQHGIFTIGAVRRFDGENINAIKLGLFSDPYVEEEAYLILATGLDNTWLGNDEGSYFSGAQQRLALPYWGQDAGLGSLNLVSLSRVIPGEIVSEGAVEVPESVQRIRPMPSNDAADPDQFLTFAENSIELLSQTGPADEPWSSAPVLEYFQPVALLRLNETDDYAEVQRLGSRCKLYLANASDINQRDTGVTSDEFDCVGYAVRAYDHTLLLHGSAVEFDVDANLRKLTETEIIAMEASIARRKTCLLSLDLMDDVTVDYAIPRDEADFTCVGPEELQTLSEEARNK